ncbi:hypothetical protein GUJ93_ZPchr0010g9687 [Zizania palustris]|uniref:TPX2 C-terminal domain-containing protein n=1 Tax=Zizania palustris TaxID=103762 RepID=A0A8J6BCM7_ZIZPA|nr:hypothetical protein GUJ93_ZPchr0010g9687 [Zizania palustris]
MATEVTQNYFAWSQEESSVQDSSQGTPQVFGHGSISFGRFELESLAWEKWSVFANDRRHEEFGKFNGLVAKKKAYFEEYFKRIRELKALQQQNQQTELNLEYSGDGSDSSQTEDVPAADHGSCSGSGTPLDSMVQTEVGTISEHDLECYDDNQNKRLNNGTSSSVGCMMKFGQEFRENASGDNYSDRMVDVLQRNTNSVQDDLRMPIESIITPKRTIEKDSLVGQAGKIIPKFVKMSSSYIPSRTVVNKEADSAKPSVVNRRIKPENIQSLQRLKAASSNIVDATGRNKLVVEELPRVIGVKRPSSPAPQRPSTRERRPITRDSTRKSPKAAIPRRPCTAERRHATGELAPKQADVVVQHQPYTPNRCPMSKVLAPAYAIVATPCRPSTAERRPMTRGIALTSSSIATPHRPSTAERQLCSKQIAQKHVGIATPSRPSTTERQSVTRDTTQKHADVATLHRPSTAERCPITREAAQKHANVVSLHRPSTAERRPVARDIAPKHAYVTPIRRPTTSERCPVARDIAPKHADVTPICRPTTSERRPATRDTALKHTNFASSCWPSTPERHLRKRAPIHADAGTTPHRPSTAERRPISKESTLTLDAKTPIRLIGVPTNPKVAMATAVIPQKTITQKLVRSSKPETKSFAKISMELQVDGKHNTSSVNLPPRKMLTSNVRANRLLENFGKPNKEEIVRSQVSASRNPTPLKTGSIKMRSPNPPPPPPPPRRSSQISSKPNTNNLSAGGRKPKASAPRWR